MSSDVIMMVNGVVVYPWWQIEHWKCKWPLGHNELLNTEGQDNLSSWSDM